MYILIDDLIAYFTDTPDSRVTEASFKTEVL